MWACCFILYEGECGDRRRGRRDAEAARATGGAARDWGSARARDGWA